MEPPRPAGRGPVRIFISHASPDREVALALTDGLRGAGLEPWLAVTEITVGENYAEEIFRALTAADAFLVILSAASVASPHVRREMNLAIDRRKQILPFSLDVAVMTSADLPVDWKYWLGVVQVEPLIQVADAVRLVVDRTARAPQAPTATRRAATGAAPVLDRAAVRAVLIQVAQQGQTFGVVVARLRSLRRPRTEIESLVREFRDRGLVEFGEPLDDTTPLHLST